MLNATVAVPTDGDTPFLVFMQALHDPRLAAVLREHPAGGVDDQRRYGGPDRDAQEPPPIRRAASAEQPAAPDREQEEQPRGVGHDAHGPVLDEDVRHVVARAVLLLVLRVDVVEPLHLAVPGVGREQRQQVRDLNDLGGRLVPIAAADLEHRERARLARLPLCLGRRDLHRLVAVLDDAELAADEHGQESGRHEHDERRGGPSARTRRHRSDAAGATPTRRA